MSRCQGADLLLLGMAEWHAAGHVWLTPQQIAAASGRAADVVHDLPVLLQAGQAVRAPHGNVYQLTDAGAEAARTLTGGTP
jgi:hypothetical protein